MKKIDIEFTCYKYKADDGVFTMFLFYPSGEWDEDKLLIQDALVNYPVDEYEWLMIEG